jgi:hypothetical protein
MGRVKNKAGLAPTGNPTVFRALLGTKPDQFRQSDRTIAEQFMIEP